MQEGEEGFTVPRRTVCGEAVERSAGRSGTVVPSSPSCIRGWASLRDEYDLYVHHVGAGGTGDDEVVQGFEKGG